MVKCLDTKTNQTVVLQLLNTSIRRDNLQIVEYCRGLMIADELQRMSDSFVKIHDIYYSSYPYFAYRGFIVIREFMGENAYFSNFKLIKIIIIKIKLLN